MSPQASRTRWFWIITAGNVIVCALLVVFIYAVMAALAAFAAGVTETPGFVLLGIGLILTAVSWPITRGAPSKRKRWLGYALNGSALAVYTLVLATVATLWLHTTRRRFLVPAGFQGELILVHTPNRGELGRKGLLRTTYRFPGSGILITQDPPPAGLFSDRYEYIYPDGHLQKLGDAGPGTLHDTPENRANKTDVVTYFPRGDSPKSPTDCSIEEISVGTRAFLLGRHDNPPAPPALGAICP